VWEDLRSGSTWRVYSYQLSTRTESFVAAGWRPTSSGDAAVFEKSGGGPLSFYDFSSHASTELTLAHQYPWDPAMAGDRIAYIDSRGGQTDLFVYDLASRTETRITSDSARQLAPSIDGSKVVWQDDRNGNWDIYACDLTSGVEEPITTDPAPQYRPSVWGNVVAWQDRRHGNWDIYGYKFVPKVTWAICRHPAEQYRPSVWNDRVVWQDKRNGTWDIYLRDLSTYATIRVTTGRRDEYMPSVYGDYIAWMDTRNDTPQRSNPDIYAARIIRLPAQLYLRAPRSLALSQNCYYSGLLRPRHAAGLHSVRLQCWHYEIGRWVLRRTLYPVNRDTAADSPVTDFSDSFRFPRRGYWRLRAYHADAEHSPSYSAWVRVTVR